MNSTLDHEVSTVPPDAAVVDESQDLRMRALALSDYFHLLALE
jgi:hypothetical protein